MSKNVPCEVRVRVTEKLHTWIKASAKERGQSISSFTRDALIDCMERSEFQKQYGISDALIKEVARKVAAEIPKEELDSEGENSAEKEG